MPSCSTRSYGSFCPVAQASEVVAQRWVPLILREIMVGYLVRVVHRPSVGMTR